MESALAMTPACAIPDTQDISAQREHVTQNASMAVPALMGTAVVGLGLEEVAVRELLPQGVEMTPCVTTEHVSTTRVYASLGIRVATALKEHVYQSA
jgi:hypothetical protein